MELDEVYHSIFMDDRWDHLRHPGISLVKGYGNSTDPIAMIVGAAPSAQDDLKRRPFTGHKGEIIRQLMGLSGLRARWVGKITGLPVIPNCSEGIPPNAFLTNLVKYRLPGSRQPNGREISMAMDSLRAEWKAIGRPKLIVTLGVAGYAFAKNDFTPKPGDWKALLDGKTFVWFQCDPIVATDEEDQEIIEGQWESMGKWLRSS